MNRILIFALVFLFIFFAACKNGDKKNDGNKGVLGEKDGATSQTIADSLYNELLKEHDQGMKGWMKIEGRQKLMKTLLDSIAKLPSKAQPSLDALKAKLNEATTALDDAYKQMDDWMTAMNLDSALNNAELRIQYLTGEKGKGSKITELINTSLQKADSLLKSKF
jgi:DNA repair ATPase RecN